MALKVELKLFCSPGADLKKKDVDHHSEDLIFIKAQFLCWHGDNWMEVIRNVYTEY